MIHVAYDIKKDSMCDVLDVDGNDFKWPWTDVLYL